jgi:predicted exporter
MSDGLVRGLTLAALAVLALYCIARLDITNSIAHFIPSESDTQLVELSFDCVDSSLSRRMALSVGGGPERAAVAEALANALRSHPEVAWVEIGFDEGALRDFYELYYERRMFLASEDPAREIPELLERSALGARAEGLRDRLTRPDSMLLARTAPADPLGLFDRILARIRASRPVGPVGGARFESTSGEHAIVLLGLRSSPFESARQAPLLQAIEAEFARLNAAHGGDLVLEQSGANRIAVAAEQSVRRDVNFISAVSITIVCSMFLLVFRSLRHLLIAFLVPVAGFAVATATALTISSPVHGITLGFGVVLIGVAIDYPIHLMNHHALSPAGTRARESIARIRPSLLLSGLTTALAFATLALSDFPGLSDMGTFAAIGVPVSLAATILVIPAFLRPSAAPSPAQRALSDRLTQLVGWLSTRRGLVIAVFVAFGAISAAGISQLRWEDDPAMLMAAQPALVAESERVRQRITDVDGGRFVVALAEDSESALALNDRIYTRLQDVIADGKLEGMHSLHAFLWSQALQRENLSTFRAIPDLGDRIDRAYSAAGFRPGAFRRFDEALASPAAEPLRPADLASTALSRTLDLLIELDGRWAIVTYLRNVRSGPAIELALHALDGAVYLDQKELVSEIYQGFRRSTVRRVALGSACVLLILLLRYRDFRRGMLAFLPSALVALTTLGLFGLLGIQVNVVSAVCLLVVVGMGVDYGVFTVDGALEPERLGATLSSLTMSCLTSVFVFGILALSEQPALRSIGLTTGTGVALALVLSPAVFVLAKRG